MWRALVGWLEGRLVERMRLRDCAACGGMASRKACVARRLRGVCAEERGPHEQEVSHLEGA